MAAVNRPISIFEVAFITFSLNNTAKIAASCSSLDEHTSPLINRNTHARAHRGPDTKTGAVLRSKV